MPRRPIAIISLIVVAAVLAGIVAFAVAQPAQPGADQGFQGAGAGRPQGMMRGMRGPGVGTPAIAVSGNAVFVVSGNMIYKFDAEALELLAQAEIPLPEQQAGLGEAAQ
jgi:hypothetical protein